MSRSRTHRSSDLPALFVIATLFGIGSWVWANLAVIGSTLAVTLAAAMILAFFYTIGRYVERREAEHRLIAGRADYEERLLAEGDMGGIYGVRYLNDMSTPPDDYPMR
ncbi:hypothetical protein [Rhodococcoides fascians]|uniref:hypothetical protein n=1 Tax=Rhodococcoides fascians TaxID=1828 RepID=UPI00050C81FD|nr:hypothetical protein [Rhodococcus fascians]